MGVSTDAILCYGVCLEEGVEFPWNGEEFESDFEKWYAKIECGLNPPTGSYDDNKDAYIAYWNKVDELKGEGKIPAKIPFEIVYHCSSECIMTILAIRGTEKRAWRGSPVVINSNDIFSDLHNYWSDQIIEFCRKYNIPMDFPEGEPERAEWLLCSYWG